MKTIVSRCNNAAARIPNLGIIIMTLLFLIVLIAIFGSLSRVFLTPRNLINILNQTSIYLILGVGMTLVMATGELDISIGSMIGFIATILGTFVLGYGLPWWLGVIACVLVGALCGAFNGLIVTKFNVPSIVVTLGTMTVFRGLAYLYQEAVVYAIFPSQIRWVTRASFLGVSFNVYLSLLIFIVASYSLTKTKTGRHLVATGANQQAAALSGIKTDLMKFLPFLWMGILAGIASIILTSRLNSAQASTGIGMEMHTIAAVVLGGTTIRGGRAVMSGTILGVIILTVISNGSTLAGLGFYWQRVIIGLLFIAVVAIRAKQDKQDKL